MTAYPSHPFDFAAAGQGHTEDDDHFHEECGVFGIFAQPQAAEYAVLGLHALQHRGQEAAGIISSDGQRFFAHRAQGLVGDTFSDPRVMQKLDGQAAIGHNRYATTGEAAAHNIQPLFAELDTGGLALAHNGNLTNAAFLRERLIKDGSIFQSSTDTEVIMHLIARSLRSHREDRLIDALTQIEGAYSIVALTNRALVGVRDPLGIRPLVLGKLGEAYILASETCAHDIIGADFLRDVEPGELVIINDKGLESRRPFPVQTARPCVFEYLYFARPDSAWAGLNVYDVRKQVGEELAREHPAEADLVVPVPDSGVPAAIGYARAADLPFDLGIIRNHYVGRTFIEPTQQIRHLGVKLKHNANRRQLDGKRVILVDDSIVRGTTSTKIVEMVRAAGASEVHMRIAAPPTAHPCFYGIDTPEQAQLLAHKYDVTAMAKHIGVDSLGFISMDGLYRALGHEGRDAKQPRYCDACFTGEYPTVLTDKDRQ
jgi:amidophosphoribosyltransferase